MACIDACDEIMEKVERPAGLIRFDSERGFAGEKVRLLRPRTIVYALLAVAGLCAAAVALAGRGDFEATVLRPRGAPFSRSGDAVQNVLRVRLVNKERSDERFRIDPVPVDGMTFVVSQQEVLVSSLGSAEVPIIATMSGGAYHGDVPLRLRVTSVATHREKVLSATFLGPGR
jgi:polyferredoxin